MAKLAYTEVFYSLQGEGRYVGVPSVFLRTFGCNFRCKGFGRQVPLDTDEKHNPEVKVIIDGGLDQYKSFKDLPLVNTGCDTYASIYPEFKRFVQHGTPEEVADGIIATLPNKIFNGEHLVITGGEPLLGWQRFYPELIKHLYTYHGLCEVTFETNGTQPLSDNLIDFILNGYNIEWTFSVSPKLSASGEKEEDAIKPIVVHQFDAVCKSVNRTS